MITGYNEGGLRVLSLETESVATSLFRTPEGRSDPYPLYHRLRDLAPVHRSDTARGWLLTRYEDCKASLRDPRFEKRYEQMRDARSKSWRDRPALAWAGKTLLNLDGPIHARLRRRVYGSFTRGSVNQLRTRVEAMTDELLGDLASSRGGELMERFAFRLPISVIGELLGVPKSDLPLFRDRVIALTAAFELGATNEMLDAADVATVECLDYFKELFSAKRAHPADDLLSNLIQPGKSVEEGLNDEELATFALLLFVAGFETTTNMIGNGVLALLDHPDQLDLLRLRPELCKNLPQELLRQCGTVQLIHRFTTEDVTFGDTVIPAGEAVFPLLGAANRDPARYPNPDRVDLTRTDIRPLAFGGGVHYCLGGALAEMELEIVFRKLVERFDVSELTEVRPLHRDRLALRAPSVVPIRLEPRPSEIVNRGGLGARPEGDDSSWRSEYRRKSEILPDAWEPEQLADRVAILERIPLFAGCRASDLTLLSATAYPIGFDLGDALCTQGGDAGDCYVITEGEARVTIEGRYVGTAGADDVVGERGPIMDLPRSATVTAQTQMITFAISRDRLHQVMKSNPTAADHMKEVLATRYGSR
jgi:cytochrome P450